jgi:hypothetical protein
MPNSAALIGSVFNYSQGFQFVWDEMKVRFTTTSDFRLARGMLLRVAKEAVGGYLAEGRHHGKRSVRIFEVQSLPWSRWLRSS